MQERSANDNTEAAVQVNEDLPSSRIDLSEAKFMAFSHCTRTGPGQGQGMGEGSMASNISCRNVHTGPRQGQQEPGPIVSYCAISVPYTGPVSGPVQCD